MLPLVPLKETRTRLRFVGHNPLLHREDLKYLMDLLQDLGYVASENDVSLAWRIVCGIHGWLSPLQFSRDAIMDHLLPLFRR